MLSSDTLEKLVYAVGGALAGFFSQLLKLVIPSYSELISANKELSDENSSLREEIRGLQDSLDDAGDIEDLRAPNFRAQRLRKERAERKAEKETEKRSEKEP